MISMKKTLTIITGGLRGFTALADPGGRLPPGPWVSMEGVLLKHDIYEKNPNHHHHRGPPWIRRPRRPWGESAARPLVPTPPRKIKLEAGVRPLGEVTGTCSPPRH